MARPWIPPALGFAVIVAGCRGKRAESGPEQAVAPATSAQPSLPARTSPLPVRPVVRPRVAEHAEVVPRRVRGTLNPTEDQEDERERAHSTAPRGAACRVDISYPEVHGLASEEAENAINGILRREAHAESVPWGPGCVSGAEHTESFVIFTNELRVLSYCEGTWPDRPGDPVRDASTCGTFDLRDGKVLNADNIVRPDARAAFVNVVRETLGIGKNDPDLETLTKALLDGEVVVEPCGVALRPSVGDLPTANQGGLARLYEIPHARIRPFLDPGSPVAAVVAKAGPWCHDPRTVSKL